ncbi:MAG TPA: ATP-binding protein, partial [bacterium]|nr:ATP-binding protein [bacterium]
GGLAGGVAHEINNPTGVILTRAQFLLRVAKEEKLSDDVVEDLVAIQKQAERIARITSSLLSFSRQQPASKAPVVVAEMVTEASALVEASLKGTDVALETSIPADLPKIVGDKGKLEQVLVNLMKNAIDAMPRGGALRVRAMRVGEKRVVITVSDTGTGIPPDVRAKIFEPFFTTKEVGKGTGLGLSIAYGIVTEHGGDLTVASEPGEGTEFHVVLPIYEAPNAALAITKEA